MTVDDKDWEASRFHTTEHDICGLTSTLAVSKVPAGPVILISCSTRQVSFRERRVAEEEICKRLRPRGCIKASEVSLKVLVKGVIAATSQFLAAVKSSILCVEHPRQSSERIHLVNSLPAGCALLVTLLERFRCFR